MTNLRAPRSKFLPNARHAEHSLDHLDDDRKDCNPVGVVQTGVAAFENKDAHDSDKCQDDEDAVEPVANNQHLAGHFGSFTLTHDFLFRERFALFVCQFYHDSKVERLQLLFELFEDFNGSRDDTAETTIVVDGNASLDGVADIVNHLSGVVLDDKNALHL